MAPDKVFTLGEYADGAQRDVIDPFGGDIEEYRQTATEIYDALTDIAEKQGSN
jgi:protein-tyrosine phosphatase